MAGGSGLRAQYRSTTSNGRRTECSRLRPIPDVEGGDDRPVVGGESPIRQGQDITFLCIPRAGHIVAEKNVIDSAVSILFGVEMGPGDFTGGGSRVGMRRSFTVSLRGTGIHQGLPAAAQNGLDGRRVAQIIQVAQDD